MIRGLTWETGFLDFRHCWMQIYQIGGIRRGARWATVSALLGKDEPWAPGELENDRRCGVTAAVPFPNQKEPANWTCIYWWLKTWPNSNNFAFHKKKALPLLMNPFKFLSWGVQNEKANKGKTKGMWLWKTENTRVYETYHSFFFFFWGGGI